MSYSLLPEWTLPNVIWMGISAFLATGYVSTYLIQSQNNIGKGMRFLLEYGKFKTYKVSVDVPKSYFTHFYQLSCCWNTTCLITVYLLYIGVSEWNWIADLFGLKDSLKPKGDATSIFLILVMLTIQSFRRLYECVFVSVYSPKARMNIIHYLWGFTYYILLAPTLISESLPLSKMVRGAFTFRHFIGCVGFLVGSYIHHQSHVILGNLRTQRKAKDQYYIPEGGLFSVVSCPHYFAELIIYYSIHLIIYAQCSSWWLVIIYNTITHINMATGNHIWYKETFSSYPKNRKALFPYLY